jgi:tetratricopeptide (TPR) repeat protein
MTSWFRSAFGKSAAKRIAEAERFAAVERWPEAIEILRGALAGTAEEDAVARAEIPRRIAEYSAAHLALLEEAIVRCLEEGDREKAEELANEALFYAADDDKKRAVRGLLAKARPEKEAPGAAETTGPDKEPENEPFGDELIDSLLFGYAESMAPRERDEVLKRPFSFQKAFVLYQQGDLEAARRAAAEFVSNNARDAYGHLYFGLTLAALEKTEDAAGELDTALLLDPSLHQAALGLAAMERRRGNTKRATALLREVLDLFRAEKGPEAERGREETFLLLLPALLETGEGAGAEKLYRELRAEGGLPEMPAVEARLTEAGGDHEGAAARWERFLRTRAAGDSVMGRGSRGAVAGPEDHEEAADFYARRGNTKRAVELYERAALLVTQRIHYSGEGLLLQDLFRLKRKIAVVFIETGRRKEAEEIADGLESESPSSPEAAAIRKALRGSG